MESCGSFGTTSPDTGRGDPGTDRRWRVEEPVEEMGRRSCRRTVNGGSRRNFEAAGGRVENEAVRPSQGSIELRTSVPSTISAQAEVLSARTTDTLPSALPHTGARPGRAQG